MFHLTVIHPFGDYARGARITDPAIVKEILEGKEIPVSEEHPEGGRQHHENKHHVVKVAATNTPEPIKE